MGNQQEGPYELLRLKKYFVEKEHETGRPRYDREKLLKIVLFAFMEFGYCSVRFIQKLCETDIRFLWLLDEENAPSHMTISNFIHNELSGSLEDIFNDINRIVLVILTLTTRVLWYAPTARDFIFCDLLR